MEKMSLFYAYSHKDEHLRKRLETHLALLKQEGLITEWHCRDINAGTRWEHEIDIHLNTAQVILLLISVDFLASKYCYNVEMKRAIERHDAGEAYVIPIILRPVDWERTAFSYLQVLPTRGIPVTDRRWHNQDAAFVNVSQGIRKAINEHITKISRPSADERIQTVLRNNAVIDHVRLFGVEQLIAQTGTLLMKPSSGWIISLFGEGGVGKTSLAYEVSSRYASIAGFTRLAWVSAKNVHISLDGELLRTSSARFRWTNLIKNIADQLDITLGYNSAEWTKDFWQGVRALSSSEKCLFIIDNLETVEDVNEAIHYLSGDQVIRPHKFLVTTRYSLLGKSRFIEERRVIGLELQDALDFIRSIGNNDIEQAEDSKLMPIVGATEGNPLLIKLFIRRALTSYLPFKLVLEELQAVHEQFGQGIVDYLYAESLALLEKQCGFDIAHKIMNAFCPLSAGDTVEYDDLENYSGIEDKKLFKNALKIACDLSLIRASKLNSKYSVHSLLWNFICD